MPASKTRSVKTRSSRTKPAPARGRKSTKKTRKTAVDPLELEVVNYTTATKWLNAHTDHERLRIVRYDDKTFSLDRMRRMLNALDNPHQQLKCVQIAGTKGKGSTCAMLKSVLQTCGYTVGCYTSPHLVDLRERIMIDDAVISHAEFADIVARIQEVTEPFGQNNKPTYFEILTAVALVYFAEQAVDIAVLETGLGGRLDATTAVDPLVCGITSISLDHMHILGKSLKKIAGEKAGIFKPNVPAICVEQDASVEGVLRDTAAEVGAPIEFTGKEVEFSYRFEANRELGPHTRISVTTPSSKFEHLPVPLRGEHQAHNCGLALAIVDKLKTFGFSFPEDKVIEGLAATTIGGRMEQVWKEPRVIIDGAHNAASIQALIKSLGAHISYDSLVLIFGCAQDKDINAILKQLALGADKVIFTRATSNPRAAEPDDLLHRFNEFSGKMAQTAPNLEEALKLAGRAVGREDLVVITGSFYLVGEAKKLFDDLPNRKAKR